MISRVLSSHRGLPVALALLGPIACGPPDGEKPVYDVPGELIVEGKPASGALVLFHPVDAADPQTPRPHGRVDRDGRFRLTTYREDDGAPAGPYVVTVDWRQEIPGRHGLGPSLLPLKYSDPKQSSLRITVVAGSNDVARLRIP
jgi:hypothetical protein